jgi:hypothetical protein
VVALGDDDPDDPPGQRRHLDRVGRPGQLGRERPLDVLVAQAVGRPDDHVGGVAGEAAGIVGVGQPAGHPGGDLGGPDPLGQHVAVEEVLLHELAEGSGELVLALDDHRGMRDGQAERVAEQGRHREPVGHAADHRRLGACLNVRKEGPVGADRGHDHEQHRDRPEESGRPSAGGGQAARPRLHRLALDRGCRG